MKLDSASTEYFGDISAWYPCFDDQVGGGGGINPLLPSGLRLRFG
jgi:hypothetical protein